MALTPVRFLLLLGLSGVVLVTLGRAFSFPSLFALGMLWAGSAGIALYGIAWLWLYDKTRTRGSMRAAVSHKSGHQRRNH